jgi:MFS transporter, DHA2 family, multidrug resistance protein
LELTVVLYLATAAGLAFCGYVTDTFGWRLRPLVTWAIAQFGQRRAITFAFTMLVLSMLLFARLMTTATPDTYYALPLALYAFCLARMLSAIASGTISKVPLARQLDAIEIYMSFRQFGASLGVTLVAIRLDWRETLHSSRLYEHLRGTGSRAQDWMVQAPHFAITRGRFSPADAQHMAVGVLGQEAAPNRQPWLMPMCSWPRSASSPCVSSR